ncbi:MAG: uracil-DNA glycosylase [Hyphomicrobium sp.]|nr:uracil-DNA glycosylase [Hyphomicrobium sp.]
MTDDDRTNIDPLALLTWYQAVGVDAVLAAMPVNWLERGTAPLGGTYAWPTLSDQPGLPPAEAPRRNAIRPDGLATPIPAGKLRPDPDHPAVPPPPARSRPQTPLAASEAETDARRSASAATSLDELEAALRAFNGCTLKATATNLCFYRGAATARTMLIGEAPGREEDLEGKPFVGRAGQLLDKMLAAIGLTEADVHITNVVYWRPPGNRTPTPQEALACRPFLDRQIALVQPDFIVVLGGSAAKEVLNVSDGIMRLRGSWRSVTIGGRDIPTLATLHPAYLLRTPAAKQLVWTDLLAIKTKLRAE